MTTEIITNSQTITDAVSAAKGLFSVTFIKRTDGTLRTMLCRRGVRLGLSTGVLSFDPVLKGLMPVMDMNLYNEKLRSGVEDALAAKESYRLIPLDAIVSATVDGVTYTKEQP